MARTSELPPSASLRQTRTYARSNQTRTLYLRRQAGRQRALLPSLRTPRIEPEIPEPAAAPLAPPLPQMAPAARVALPVSFSNPIALRVAFLMSLITMLLTMIPFVNYLSPVWWLVAGSAAVTLYRRLTGMSLSVGAGARLGSITGVLAFLSLVVIIALTVAFAGKDLFQEMVKQNPGASRLSITPLRSRSRRLSRW